MRILAIETSCDETAVCLLEAGGTFPNQTGESDFSFRVLGNALTSQAALHAEYGGVFPNLAKREHAKNLVPMLLAALGEAGEIQPAHQGSTLISNSEPTHQGSTLISSSVSRLNLDTLLAREPELLEQIVPFLEAYTPPQIDAIAVTSGPGLEPALWVGINFAKALSLAWGVPLVAVNHMEGHVLMSMMEIGSPSSGHLAAFEFPVLALLISGGHTELVLSRTFGEYEVVGETRDDAAGEAFDKVARLMDLPYPGGPEISRLAAEAREMNLKADFSFTRPMLHEKNLDFSFSGLKTAVRNAVIAHGPLSDDMRKMIAREFEECVADVLVTKSLRAAEAYGASTLVVGGGVSANTFIRSELARRIEASNALVKVLVPPPNLATDNALMIAIAGFFRAKRRMFVDAASLAAKGNAKISDAG